MATVRFYPQFLDAPYSPATMRGSWDGAGTPVDCLLATAKTDAGTQGVNFDLSSSVAGFTQPVLRMVSGALPRGGTVGATLTAMFALFENDAWLNCKTRIYAYVTVGDSDTVRGVICDWTDTVEWHTAAYALSHTPDCDAVAHQAGDHIVIILGVSESADHAWSGGAFYYGGNQSTDLAAGGNGWSGVAWVDIDLNLNTGKGQTHYISTTGTGTWADSLSASTPCSVATMLLSYYAGDTCVLRAGTYAGRPAFTANGTTGEHVAFQPYTGEDVIFSEGLEVYGEYLDFHGGTKDDPHFEIVGGTDMGDTYTSDYAKGQLWVYGPYCSFKGWNFDTITTNSAVFLDTTAHHTTIDGFVVDGVRHYGIVTAIVDDCTIRNGSLTGYTGFAGVAVMGNRHLIENCTFAQPTGGYDMYVDGSLVNVGDGDGIRVNYSDGTVIRGCTIHRMFPQYSADQHLDWIQTWNSATNLLVEKCLLGTWEIPPGEWTPNGFQFESQSGEVSITIRDCVILTPGTAEAPWYCGAMTSTPGTLNIKFYGNTFWSAPPQLTGTGSTYTFRNNVFRRSLAITSGSPTVDSDYNAFLVCTEHTTPPTFEGSHSFTFTDPLLTDLDVTSGAAYGLTADWRPATGSPLIGAGVAGYSTTDMAGVTRPSAPSIGAYEPRPPGCGSEMLRIYKRGSDTYSDVTSASAGGFSDLTRVQVLNDAGSLTFTLTGTTPAMLAEWIDEAATVQYWVDGVNIETYAVDSYAPRWSALTCDVNCVGVLAAGTEPGPVYPGPYLLLDPIAPGYAPGWDATKVRKDTVANILREVVQCGTYVIDHFEFPTGWSFSEADVYTPVGILACDDFRIADHRFHAEIPGTGGNGTWYRDEALVSPWHDGGGDVVPVIGCHDDTRGPGGIGNVITGTDDWMAYYDGFTARADMYVQAASINSVTANSRADLIARRVSSTSYYMAHFSDTFVAFHYHDGSGFHQIGSNSANAWVAGDLLGFSVVGTTLKAYVNGAVVKTATDSHITAAGYAGLRGVATSGTHLVAFTSFCVTAGDVPQLSLGLSYDLLPLADVIKDLCVHAGYTFWFDAEQHLHIERSHTSVDNTYTVNGTMHDFDSTYSALDIVNDLRITNGDDTWEFTDDASIAAYGLRTKRIDSTVITTEGQAQSYSTLYFAQWAQPRLSARILVDHDPTRRPGLRVAATGLGDGRTYSELIQQITYTVGDLWDELVLGTPALALNG